jgi:HEAT repeat protein
MVSACAGTSNDRRDERMNKIKTWLCVGVVVGMMSASVSASAQNIPFNSAPKPNAIQDKYYTWENQAGGLKCALKPELEALLREPNKCYMDLDECAPGLAALDGTIDPKLKVLLHDAIRTDDDAKSPKFLAECPGDGPKFLFLLGFKGVGYANMKEALPDLHKLVTKERVDPVGQNVRSAVTDALFWLGKNDDSIKALMNLIELDTKSFKHHVPALQALQAWGSDAAIPYCTDALTSKTNQELVKACIDYLGSRGAKDTYPMMLRLMEKYEEEVIRAMGSLGDKQAIEVLEAFLEKNDNNYGNRRVAAVVSLINLGQNNYMKELAGYLKGEKHLSKKQLEKKKKGKSSENPDFELIQQAAMESVRLTNTKVEKELTKALQAAAKTKDAKNWKAEVYGNLALAQRGDKAASAALVKLLNSPEEKVRKAVLDAIGARFDVPRSNFMNRGTGVVADPALLPAVFAYYKSEPKKADKTAALKAAVTIRTFVELNGAK